MHDYLVSVRLEKPLVFDKRGWAYNVVCRLESSERATCIQQTEKETGHQANKHVLLCGCASTSPPFRGFHHERHDWAVRIESRARLLLFVALVGIIFNFKQAILM